MSSILRFWHCRIVHIDSRVVQGPFRGSKKQLACKAIWPSGKIGHPMGRKRALVQVWGAFFRNGAVAHTKWRFWRPRLLNAAPTLHTPVPGSKNHVCAGRRGKRHQTRPILRESGAKHRSRRDTTITIHKPDSGHAKGGGHPSRYTMTCSHPQRRLAPPPTNTSGANSLQIIMIPESGPK